MDNIFYILYNYILCDHIKDHMKTIKDDRYNKNKTDILLFTENEWIAFYNSHAPFVFNSVDYTRITMWEFYYVSQTNTMPR